MKTTIFLPLMLCCVVAAAQEPVQLEVWRVNKSNPFRGVFDRFCYLPDFRNGIAPHAMVVRKRSWDDKIDRMETWYNRDINDTLNQFTWPFGFCPAYTPDINGDGRRDFMNETGMLYLGTEKDEPDTNKVYEIRENGYAGYAKVNNDNCDDIYYYGGGETPNPYMAHFIFGNTTLKTLQKYSVVSTNVLKDSLSYERPKAIFKNKQGKWRLLTGAQGWIKGTYRGIWVAEKSVMRLYSLDFKHINADSTVIIAEQIDEYKDPKWLEHKEDIHSKDPLNWRPLNDAGLLYNTENFPRILYYGSFNTVPDKQTKKYESYATIIDLTEDKIRMTNINITEAIPDCKMLKHSIDGDMTEELYVKSGPFIYFYSIDSQGIPKNTLRFTLPEDRYKGGLRGLTSINDINNDGINDVAILSSDNSVGNYFAIVKGKKILNSIFEIPVIDFSLDTPYPLPNSSELIIPIVCKKNGIYSLFIHALDGSSHTIFNNKEFEVGATIYSFNTSTFSAGSYILSLNNGKISVEKTIIINH